jgi:DNA mismatch repair protein MutS
MEKNMMVGKRNHGKQIKFFSYINTKLDYTMRENIMSQIPNIYDEYFECVNVHIKQCGEKTVVLMQVGDFYEMYDASYQDTTKFNALQEVIQHCSLATSCSRTFRGQPLMMAGVNIISLDKYVQMIVDAGYNAVIYVQTKEYDETNKKLKRVLGEIHSPGTFINNTTYTEIQTSNHILCIWLESHANKISFGVSVINTYDGKSFTYEGAVSEKIQCTSFDELENFVSIYRPKECIIIVNLNYGDVRNEHIYQSVLQQSGLSMYDIHVHKYDSSKKEVINCAKQTYIQNILNNHFGDDCLFQCNQFLQYIYATQAFCFLLHFIHERNPSLIKHIYMPIFTNISKHTTLANHTLKQLNILSDGLENGKECGNLQSVHTFLNKCNSAIGKRRFHSIMTHPTFDEKWLKTEYEMMDRFLLENETMIPTLRMKIKQLVDIDKICKQISNRKLVPFALSQLNTSLENIEQIHTCLFEMPDMVKYLCESDFVTNFDSKNKSNASVFQNNIFELTTFLDSHVFLEKCKSCTSMTNFEENIIRPNICESLDILVNQYEKTKRQLDCIQEFFESLFESKKSGGAEFIKRNCTEKNGVSLQLTKPRSEILKKQFQSKPPLVELREEVKFTYSEIQFTSPGKNTIEIRFPLLDSICTNITRLKNAINSEISIQYLKLLEKIDDTFINTIGQCSLFVGKLDVLLSKCHCAKAYNYKKPTIVSDAPKSFIHAKDVRHVLIEQLLKQEVYVPNDISLGLRQTQEETVDGILLYGTNAVGKTSLIRSLGICIVMAQCGMYVPCSEFVFKPYKSIYSRILSNDNLFKGLSTFAVEMSELRVILEQSDENSFIMGDELCSGTETESALSIVIASLEILHAKQSTFMFATHFHELVDYDELKALTRIRLKHLQVMYDELTGNLIYERKMQDGPGTSSYGLEVCKSLFMGKDFLDRAYFLRSSHFEQTKGPLSIDSSRYNSQKLKGKCESCDKQLNSNEIHHIGEQRNADKNGFIDSFHKNHVGNLMTLCTKCHDKLHSESSPDDKKKRRTKTSLGYKFV